MVSFESFIGRDIVSIKDFTREEFERYNIFFQEDETYIQKILEKAGVVKNG